MGCRVRKSKRIAFYLRAGSARDGNYAAAFRKQTDRFVIDSTTASLRCTVRARARSVNNIFRNVGRKKIIRTWWLEAPVAIHQWNGYTSRVLIPRFHRTRPNVYTRSNLLEIGFARRYLRILSSFVKTQLRYANDYVLFAYASPLLRQTDEMLIDRRRRWARMRKNNKSILPRHDGCSRAKTIDRRTFFARQTFSRLFHGFRPQKFFHPAVRCWVHAHRNVSSLYRKKP